MPDIPYSCPHFDEAKKRIAHVRDTFQDLADALDTADSEIEEARTINAALRDENYELRQQLEQAEATVAELEDKLEEALADD